MHDQVALYSVLLQQRSPAGNRRAVTVSGRELRRSRRSRRARRPVQ